MNKITKNILWGVILGSPVGVSFAANSAYMDKINQVTQALNSSLHTKYDLPAISQYFSGGGGTPSTPSTSVTPSRSSMPSTPAETSTPSDIAPSTGGSVYVQPGDSGSSGSGSSGSSGGGFNYSNLY